MRSWIVMLWGLLVWAAHFFALYGIAEFAGPSPGSRTAVVLLTALALALVALGAYRLRRCSTSGGLAGWSVRLGRGALSLSALAIVWQAFPAFLS